jgi:hypothetical protein
MSTDREKGRGNKLRAMLATASVCTVIMYTVAIVLPQ